MERKKILVIGVGNEFRGDDAVGVLVARRLAEHTLPTTVTVLEQSGEGSDLMAAWEGADHVFLIDAARSDAALGTIHRFEASQKPLATDFFSFSSHAFGVAEAIEISRMLGELPKRVIVYGIESCNFDTGSDLSPEVRQAVENVIRQLLQEIEEL